MDRIEEQQNQLYLGAKVMLESIDDKIIDYYYKKIHNTEVADQIYDITKEWFFEKLDSGLKNEVNLLNIVYYILDNSTALYPTPKASYMYYKENKRNRKNYLFKTIKDEYSGKPNVRNPLYLKQKADFYFGLKKMGGTNEEYDTPEEYIKTMYEEISAWRDDSSSYIFDFMFFETLELKRKANCFLIDLGENIFKIINKEYYGKLNGGLTTLPNAFLEGIFTLRREEVNLQHEITGTAAIAKHSSAIINEDGSKSYVTTIYDSITDDFSQYTEKERVALIERYVKDDILKSTTETLSAFELAVFTVIYNYFNLNVLTEGKISVPGKQFVQQLLTKDRLKIRDIRRVLHSLEKLQSIEINMEKRDAKGNVTAIGKASFFDITYGDLSSEGEVTYSINSDENSNSEMDESLLMSDNWTINVYPTAFLKELWNKNVNAEIYTRQYNQISSAKAKALMLVLQQERVLSYPASSRLITYNQFKSKIRMDKLKPSQMKKELSEQLTILQEEGVVIKSFNLTTTGVTVEFLPFTELEKDLYKINDKAGTGSVEFMLN